MKCQLSLGVMPISQDFPSRHTQTNGLADNCKLSIMTRLSLLRSLTPFTCDRYVLLIVLMQKSEIIVEYNDIVSGSGAHVRLSISRAHPDRSSSYDSFNHLYITAKLKLVARLAASFAKACKRSRSV